MLRIYRNLNGWLNRKTVADQTGAPVLFVVASMPRSGTHMLQTLLNEHPDIRTETELFNSQARRCKAWLNRPARWVLQKKAWYEGRERIRGFLLHLDQNEPWQVWEHLHAQSDVRYICVRRWNLLEQYVSHQQALMHKRWQTYRGQDRPELRPLEVDADDLESYIERILGHWTSFEERFGDRPTITVWYEQLCRQTAQAARQVQQFLGAQIVEGLQPATIKIGRPARELIRNYEQLRRHFSGSPHESFFDPPGLEMRARAA